MIKMDAYGNIFLTGKTEALGTDFDYTAIKLAQSLNVPVMNDLIFKIIFLFSIMIVLIQAQRLVLAKCQDFINKP